MTTGKGIDLKGSRVLVIGGAGFVGSHLIDQLVQSEAREIVVYDNFSRGKVENLARALKDPRVKVFELGGDVLHTDILEAATQGVDCVFHLAALWLLHCHDYPRSAFEVNVRGTFNVLEACVKNGVKRLVYSSSASVYGDAVTTPMEEDHPFNNRTFYGATKIAGEQMARAFAQRYGLNYVGLRYMNVYGPRQDYKGAYVVVIMKMLDRLDRGLAPVIYGDGTQTYDFVYVEDVARANVLAAQSSVTDEFFNVGTGKGTTIRELTDRILKITGAELKPVFEPQGTTFVTQRIGSARKAQERLGFRASVGLEEGLKRLIDWRREHLAQAGA